MRLTSVMCVEEGDSYLWNSHSRLSRGQTCRVLSQREMQWKWKAWLQTPQATVHSSLVAEAWFAWHSIPGNTPQNSCFKSDQFGNKGRGFSTTIFQVAAPLHFAIHSSCRHFELSHHPCAWSVYTYNTLVAGTQRQPESRELLWNHTGLI